VCRPVAQNNPVEKGRLTGEHRGVMKTTAALLAAALFAGNAVAAEYGIGLSAKSDNGLIYFPIDVSPKWRVEPYVRYSTDHTDSLQTVPPTVTIPEQETDILEVGTGVFGLASPRESLRVSYGARVGYVNVHSVFRIDTGSTTIRDTDTTEGYHVAPTFGFEYLFNSHFTLGGEVAYFYQHLESEETFGTGRSKFESDETGTEGFLILRYFF
jgi:hypothetical protein